MYSAKLRVVYFYTLRSEQIQHQFSLNSDARFQNIWHHISESPAGSTRRAQPSKSFLNAIPVENIHYYKAAIYWYITLPPTTPTRNTSAKQSMNLADCAVVA